MTHVRAARRPASFLRLLPLSLLFLPALASAEPATPTVDELVARAIDAIGGAERIRALKTVRMTAKVVNGAGDYRSEAESSMVATQGLRTRNEYTLQGMTAVSVWDGKTGWSVSPFGGRRDPERISDEDAKGMIQATDIQGVLFDWKAKGHKVELLGKEEVDGGDAWKLRVERKDGDTLYVFLDPDSYLEVRHQSVSRRRGTESRYETDFGNYQWVDGLLLPFTIESGPPDGPRYSHTLVQRWEVNVPLDDAFFQWPTKEKPAVRALFPGPAPKKASTPPKRASAPAASTSGTPSISGLGIRNIGSAKMSGRVAALDAFVADGKTTLYVGAASGGVWKSIDGGTTFEPKFDKEKVQSIGAITIDPSDRKTIWVGTGESWTRNSVSIGDGIYKSTDAGETWKNMGLPESERIVRILVHPKKRDTVYACVPGKLWSDSDDRGVYRTTDGGGSWSKILAGGNASTGCSTLAWEAENPDAMYAGMWDFRRKGWTFRSGGEVPEAPSASAMYRSTDGGDHWTPMDDASNKGLPKKPWGRIEIAVAPSDPTRVYAFVEGIDPALYVSNDRGRTFEQRDKSFGMIWRPFYFARMVVDPKNPDRLFKMGGGLIVSDDGGKSFSYSGGGGHGDWHDVWFDPTNSKHVIGGDDGGLWQSFEGGNRWWKTNNLPISQFYHVSVDGMDPYNVYGGLQDNSSWMAPSAAPGGLTNDKWQNLYYGDGFWVQVDPIDPDVIYAEYQGGYISRIDRKTKTAQDIQPKARVGEKLRYNWNAPIVVSAAGGGRVYLGSQFLFRSKEKGDTWDRISPDLTTNDPEKQKQEQSGGVSVDNSSAEMHCSIYSIAESPKDPNQIWVGTDDGNVQLTRDGGKSWTLLNPNITGLPAASWVSWIDPSPFDAGTAHVTFDRHTFGDMTPWVYRTTDFGKSWTRIVGPGSGVRGYAHCVRQDIVSKEILYVGTEFGLFASLDSGSTWQQYKPDGFPQVAVRDIALHPRENDLVLATHGRGIWIVDDLTPLRAFAANSAKPIALLPGRGVQQRMGGIGGWVEGDNGYYGDNPSGGAPITYALKSRPLIGTLKLEVFDAKGQLVEEITPSKKRGLNRVTWSMREKPPRVPRAAQLAGSSTQGTRVLPGRYTVRLTAGDDVAESVLEVGLDRRAKYTLADRTAQHDAAMAISGLFGQMSDLVDRMGKAKGAVEARIAKLPENDSNRKRLAGVLEKLGEQRTKIVATKEGGQITGEERIREHLDTLYGAVNGYEGRPPDYQLERLEVLRTELGTVAREFEDLVKRELPELENEPKKKM